MKTTLTSTQLPREFSFNGVKLEDPGIEFDVDEVRTLYANQYPELNTAVVEDPQYTGTAVAYKFVRSVGTKGL